MATKFACEHRRTQWVNAKDLWCKDCGSLCDPHGRWTEPALLAELRSLRVENEELRAKVTEMESVLSRPCGTSADYWRSRAHTAEAKLATASPPGAATSEADGGGA